MGRCVWSQGVYYDSTRWGFYREWWWCVSNHCSSFNFSFDATYLFPLITKIDKRFKNAQFKNMEFLEIVLQEAQICNVPLVFVLNHFSAFCHLSKQTLLYTLLDMCSNKRVQMCVIGIDRDCSVTEQLEKRIQSRFSQKQIIVTYPSVADFIQFTSSTLFLTGKDSRTRKWNSMVKMVVLDKDFSRLIEEQSALIPISYNILLFELVGSFIFRWNAANSILCVISSSW